MPATRLPLAERLKELRASAGLSQREVAERCELSLEFISRIERGVASPSLDVMMRLCDALGCTPNDLLLRDKRRDSATKLYERLRHSPPETARRAIHAAEAILAYERRKS